MKKILTVAVAGFVLLAASAVSAQQTTKPTVIQPEVMDVFNKLSASSLDDSLHGVWYKGTWGGGNGSYQNVIDYGDGQSTSDSLTTNTSKTWGHYYSASGWHSATLTTGSGGLSDTASATYTN